MMDNELLTQKNWWQRYWILLTSLAILGIFGIGIIIYASTGLKAEPEKEIPFDSTKWKMKRKLDYPYRLQMLNQLVYTDTLRNLKNDEILQLLGTPNEINEVYIYYTVAQKRIGLFPVNTKSLVIRLNRDGSKNKVMIHG